MKQSSGPNADTPAVETLRDLKAEGHTLAHTLAQCSSLTHIPLNVYTPAPIQYLFTYINVCICMLTHTSQGIHMLTHMHRFKTILIYAHIPGFQHTICFSVSLSLTHTLKSTVSTRKRGHPTSARVRALLLPLPSSWCCPNRVKVQASQSLPRSGQGCGGSSCGS